jgi:hypothetical protein
MKKLTAYKMVSISKVPCTYIEHGYFFSPFNEVIEYLGIVINKALSTIVNINFKEKNHSSKKNKNK